MSHNILLLIFLGRSCHFFGKGFFTNSLTQKWLTDISLIPKLFEIYSCLLGTFPVAPLISLGSFLPIIFKNKLEQASKGSREGLVFPISSWVIQFEKL